MDYLNKMLSHLKSKGQSKYEYHTKRLEFEKLFTEVYKKAFNEGMEQQRVNSQLAKNESSKTEMEYMGIKIHKAKNCHMWYTRFRVAGKQYYISAKTQVACFEKLVKAKSTENVEELLRVKDIFASDKTLEEWYAIWLNLYKNGRVREETLRRYKTLWNSIPKELKSTQMREITLPQILLLINSYDTSSKQKRIYDFLNMMFSKALDNEIISRNVLRKVDKPKYIKIHSKALTLSQQRSLIDACRKVPHADFIAVALYQGFRRGEVLGITRDCVDFDNKKILIDKAWSQRNKFDRTKNEQSVRKVPMFDKTYKIMLKYKNLQSDSRLFNISIKTFEKVMKEVRKVSGLPKLRIKDLRCTFITNCRNKNIPLHIVQTWVGHQIGSVVTSAIYTSYMENADAEFIKEINKFSHKNYK